MIKNIFLSATICVSWSSAMASEQLMQHEIDKSEYNKRVNILAEEYRLSPIDVFCAQAYGEEIRKKITVKSSNTPSVHTKGLPKTDRTIIAIVKNQRKKNSQALKVVDANRTRKSSETIARAQELPFNATVWGKEHDQLRPLQNNRWIE